VADAQPHKWSLTREAFDGLLDALGSDRDSAAARYLEIRRNLVRLFEWRGCGTPDEYADETINRCAKKIGEGVEIRDLPTYAIGVARMLLREMARERIREMHLDHAPEPRVQPVEPGGDPEIGVKCLKDCLAQLSPVNRDLIVRYYEGDKGHKIRSRKGLMQLFGIPAGTLRMRALRLRETLQLCTENCLNGQKGNQM
jgi:DNA-directed RNA polymerase specialized sigma24 family protein